MRKIGMLLLTFLIAASLVACSNDKATGSGTYKDTVIWAINNDQDTMDPQTNVSNSVMLPQIYSSLLTIDINNKVVGDVAKSWSVADDGLTWTFELNEGIKFHNGKELTSADVLATFKRLLDTDNPVRYTQQYSFIESVSAPSDYEFVITTAEPYGSFEVSMAAPNAAILDADYLAAADSNFGMDPATINGTGPYKVTSWTPGEEMIIEAHEEYFKGEAQTQKFILRVIPEQNSREIALENGEVDIASGISPAAVIRYKDGGTPGVSVSINEGNGIHLFQFNAAGVLADTKLRQAISYGIDREAIVSTLYADNGEVAATAPITPSVVGYTDLGVIEQDQDKAKALLAEAGYADGLTITMMTTNVYNKGIEMAEIIKQQLAEINVTVNIETVEKAVFLSTFGITADKLKYDMFIMGAGGAADANTALYRVWHSEALTDGVQLNTNNYGFYKNAKLDALLEEGAITVDKDKASEIYKEAMEIIWETDPVGVFMNFRNNIYGVSDTTEGFVTNARNTPDLVNVKVGE